MYRNREVLLAHNERIENSRNAVGNPKGDKDGKACDNALPNGHVLAKGQVSGVQEVNGKA